MSEIDEAVLMAIVVGNGCGCTIEGERVPCDHPKARDSIDRGPFVCDCRATANAVLRVLAVHQQCPQPEKSK